MKIPDLKGHVVEISHILGHLKTLSENPDYP